MASDPPNRPGSDDPPYRVYRSEQASRSRRGRRSDGDGGVGVNAPSDDRPYTVYRAGPKSLRSRLRGEEEAADAGGGGRWRGRRRGGAESERRWTPGRVLKYVAIAIAAWLLLSLILFVTSAQIEKGNLPASASNALSGGGNMLTSTQTVLILGTDQRPTKGAGSKEPGANKADAGSHSDTIMLWRIGGGTSRRLSIPRDTVAQIPGHGLGKINAGYALGGPALAIKTIQRFTGVPINHVIVVNLAAFPQFIDSIGGLDVTTGRVCSDISGGAKNGGFSLNLQPGTHHLDGRDALTLARTRENKCNPAENDLTRVKRQQQILNAVKSKLFSPSAFFRLPLASWNAPKVLRTDMGGLTLLSLFAASEIGGSAPPNVLKPTGAEVLPAYGDSLTVTPDAVHRAIAKLMNG